MPKCFQIFNGLCYVDVSSTFPTAESTIGYFQPDWIFVDAPDYVFEGWGYDPDAIGDDRFIQPVPPEGWLYDDLTGVFYPEDGEKPLNLTEEELQIKSFADALRAGVDSV